MLATEPDLGQGHFRISSQVDVNPVGPLFQFQLNKRSKSLDNGRVAINQSAISFGAKNQIEVLKRNGLRYREF